MEFREFIWYLLYLYIFYKTLGWVYFLIIAYQNYQKGQRIRKERDSKIYDFPEENKEVLVCTTIQELVDGQISGKFTATDIVNTFAKRCYIIGRKYNYTCDEMFERALKEAEEKDTQLQSLLDQGRDPRNALGKLHGVPFSVKDHIWVEGTISSLGVSSMADNVRNKDTYIVQALRKEGAIPLVKGNTPEGCFSFHTTNYIWGEAKNPWDTSRTCGGSTGGDSALVASGCIPFSIGSDMMGSLRVPALFCGIYSLFPTLKRLYAKRADTYLQDNIFNFELMKYALGPLARNASDLTLLSEIIFSENVYGEYRRYPKIPFNKTLHSNNNNLKIGILNDVGKLSALSKTAERSIEITAQILEDNEHEVANVDLIEDVKEQSQMMLLCGIYTFTIPLRNIWLKSKDIVNLNTFSSIILGYTPKVIIKIVAVILKLFGEKRNSFLLKSTIEPSAQDIMDFTMKRDQMVQKTVEKWKELNLDALIVPTYPIPAFKRDNFEMIKLMPGGYRLSCFWGFPSGFVPITTVREDEQEYIDANHNDSISNACAESMKDSKGMPMGVEVICMPYKEEQVLRIMELLQKDSKFHVKNPYPDIH
ncbi:unnamed protein product [Moneuplotes crassus]|uniref:Amidase domain-containing protein n=1 Tax=Euplotes crassus TaxID=5936 RepID=A0AAD1UEG4_EUPCR|nr:unnamed protein product [Moneuplotes crassus]